MVLKYVYLGRMSWNMCNQMRMREDDNYTFGSCTTLKPDNMI